MRWSISLGTISGITVRFHITFLLLLIWIGVGHYAQGGAEAAVVGLVFILLIFGSVLLHEFGHALAARRFGVKTPDITLLPIGGVARLERIPEKPTEEFIVAVAGPAVNVAIAAFLYILVRLLTPSTFDVTSMNAQTLMTGNILSNLLSVNVWLVLFNLIPAFPMDGGRILRALLAMKLSYTQATRVAANVGQLFAFVFVLIGFFGNPLLIFIGLFVYMGAGSEVSGATLREFSRGVPVGDAMVIRFQLLRESAPLAEAVDALLAGSDKEFPVLDANNEVAGLLRREDIVRGLKEKGPATPVGEVMQTNIPTVYAHDMLDRAFQNMMEGKHAALPVIDAHGHVIGLLTRENVAELMMIQGTPHPPL